MINQTISHYRVVEKIAQGGMGIVYKAEDLRLNRVIALKFLHPDMTRDEEAIERFLNEAQLVSSLDHPNICNLYEVDKTADSQFFMAMAYYEGQTLYERLRAVKNGLSEPIGIMEAIDIIQQTLQGLIVAHDNGVLHRDIKPGNLIINRRGEVKILDFGLAKLAGQARITKRGSAIGTIAYMSPEQSSGEEVDQRGDIWSVGVVMYEMLSSRLPFQGEMEMAIIYSILKKQPEPLDHFRSGIPSELSTIIEKALQKNLSKRYQTAGEMLFDLDSLKEKLAVQKAEETKGIPQTAARNRLTATLGITVLAVFLSIFLILQLNRRVEGDRMSERQGGSSQTPEVSGQTYNSIAILYFENMSGDAKYDFLGKAISYLIMSAISQSRYYRVLTPDRLQEIHREAGLPDNSGYSAKGLKIISGKARMEYLLFGRYFIQGENIRISMQLMHSGQDAPLTTWIEEGIGEDSVFQIIDNLVVKVNEHFELTPAQLIRDYHKSTNQISTSSLEAMNYYVVGRELFYNQKYSESNQILFKAIEIDPNFALAQWAIAVNYSYLGNYHAKLSHLYKALAMSERISYRDYLMIQAYSAYQIDDNPQKAIQLYHELLKIYPNDESGRIALGAIFRNLEEWEAARTQFSILLKVDPELYSAITNYAYVLIFKAKFQEAIEFLSDRSAVFRDRPYPHLMMARSYYSLGKFSEARREAEEAQKKGASSELVNILKGDIAFLESHDDQAEEYYREALRHPNSKSGHLGNMALANFYLAKGMMKESLIHVEAAIEKVDKEEAQFDKIQLMSFKVFLYWKFGDFEKAESVCKAIGTIVKDPVYAQFEADYLFWKILFSIQTRRFHPGDKDFSHFREIVSRTQRKKKELLFLQSLILEHEGKKNELEKNLLMIQPQILNPIVYYYPQTIFLSKLIEFYQDCNDSDKMGKILLSIIKIPYARLSLGHCFHQSLFFLGKWYHQKGEQTLALEYLRRYIAMMGKGDIGRGEIRTAQSLIEIIKNKGRATNLR